MLFSHNTLWFYIKPHWPLETCIKYNATVPSVYFSNSHSSTFMQNLISVSIGIGFITQDAGCIEGEEERVQMIHMAEGGSHVPDSVIYVPHIAMEVLINKHLPPELLESRGKPNFSALTSSVQPCRGNRTPYPLHHPTTQTHPPTPANKAEISGNVTSSELGLKDHC